MKQFLSFWLAITLTMSLFSFIPTTFAENTTQSSEKEYKLHEFEKRVFELVNEERKKHDLKPLILSMEVCKTAREKSEDMRDKDYFSHESPTYGNVSEHTKKKYAGENIAAAYKTPEEVMEAWMKSKGHRENILRKEYTHIGVGYAEGGGKYERYWTQQFFREEQ